MYGMPGQTLHYQQQHHPSPFAHQPLPHRYTLPGQPLPPHAHYATPPPQQQAPPSQAHQGASLHPQSTQQQQPSQQQQQSAQPQPPPPIPSQLRGAVKDPFKHLHSRDFVGHKKKVHSVVWNCLGDKLASGSVDQTIRVWQVDTTGQPSRHRELELRGHTESVDNLCWDPVCPHLLASASQDKSVRLWDARSGRCEQSVTLRGENINVTYKPDGQHIAVGNSADELTILDVRKLKPIHKRKFNYELNEFQWDRTGTLFLVTTGTGAVEVLAYPLLNTLDSLHAHTAGVYSLAIDPRGRYFAAGSADALVSLWDISQMLCVRTFTRLEWPVRTVSFSHDGRYLASASEDLFVDIAEVETGRSVHQIPSWAAMNSVEWNPKHHLLAYASDDDGKHSSPGVFRVFGFETPYAN